MDFKKQHTLEERKDEASRILEKYPERIPVIVQKNKGGNSEEIPTLKKTKFLVPEHISMGQFIYIIRQRINLAPEKGLFLFVDNTIPNSSSDMKIIYNQHKDEDGFLYVGYSSESTFG